MKEFFTRAGANAGTRIELKLPDGKPSPHWLHVLGADGDVFRQAAVVASREVVRAISALPKTPTDAELAKIRQEARLRNLAAVIESWSFPQPCDEDNKLELLREAPQIADAVDRLITDRSLFTNGSSANSDAAPEAQPS